MDSPKRPYPDDDVLNASVYNTAQEIDRILNRCTIQDHAAVLGIVQVTSQRRAHEYQERQNRNMQSAQAELQKRQAEAARDAKFGIQ